MAEVEAKVRTHGVVLDGMDNRYHYCIVCEIKWPNQQLVQIHRSIVSEFESVLQP